MPVPAIATAVIALNCWAAAAIRYDVPVDLLFAIGQVESRHRADAISRPNANGTVDLGIMQINSSWLPALRQFGITREILLRQPCANIQVGAWILAQEIARTGYTWQTIGAYNAGPLAVASSPRARRAKLSRYRAYAAKVLDRWRALEDRRAAKRRSGLAVVDEIADARR